jgi:hypothetical protein
MDVDHCSCVRVCNARTNFQTSVRTGVHYKPICSESMDCNNRIILRHSLLVYVTCAKLRLCAQHTDEISPVACQWRGQKILCIYLASAEFSTPALLRVGFGLGFGYRFGFGPDRVRKSGQAVRHIIEWLSVDYRFRTELLFGRDTQLETR